MFNGNEGFHRPPKPSFPETGICKQRCREYCGGTCKLNCFTHVNGKQTEGCSNLRSTTGNVPPYPCHRSHHKGLKNALCMAKT